MKHILNITETAIMLNLRKDRKRVILSKHFSDSIKTNNETKYPKSSRHSRAFKRKNHLNFAGNYDDLFPGH